MSKYIVIDNGLFKDSLAEEAVVDKELQHTVMLKPRRMRYDNTITRQVLEEALTVAYSREQVMPVIHTGEAGQQALGEALHRELESQLSSYRTLTGTPIITGTAGEFQLENEQMWANTRNESMEPLPDVQPPTREYIAGYDPYLQIQDRDSITITRNMTEQELINYFDTISNEEEQQTNTEH